MDLKIGIPSDGRCEMSIIFCRKSEMSGILRRIPRLFHRPERKSADQIFLRFSLYFLKQFLDLFRPDLISDMDMIAEAVDKCRKLSDPVLIRRFMRPVKKRNLPPEKLFRHCLICHKHKIFDNLCRRISVIRLYFDRFSIFIQNNLRLRKVKIDSAPFSPFLSDQLR